MSLPPSLELWGSAIQERLLQVDPALGAEDATGNSIDLVPALGTSVSRERSSQVNNGGCVRGGSGRKQADRTERRGRAGAVSGCTSTGSLQDSL